MAQLFYAYASQDVRLRDQLEKHLRGLKQRGVLSDWHSRAVGPGSAWRGEISPQLEQSDVVLLLVSGDFVTTEYCHGKEVRRALERHRNGEARVIPVLLRPCNWKSTLFGTLRPQPRDGKPVTRWSSADTAFESLMAVIAAPSVAAANALASEAAGDDSDRDTDRATENGVAAGRDSAAARLGNRPGQAAVDGSATSTATDAGMAHDLLPAQVALPAEEIAEGFVGVDAPTRGEDDAAAQEKFVSVAAGGARRVAQLVYRTKSAEVASSRLDAGVRAEVAKGGLSELVPPAWDWATPTSVRRVILGGGTVPGAIVYAAKGRFLVAAKVIGGDASGTASESPADLAGSVVRRMLARIPAGAKVPELQAVGAG